MIARLRPSLLFPLLASVAALSAQTPRLETVFVEETRLTFAADGTTRVRFDDTVPAASRSLGALTTRVANLHLSDGGAGSFGSILTLRGLANTPYFSDPSVTVYFDDLPLGSSFTYPTGLFGFAAATVARGPQQTAFGRGGEGGVITLTSTEPRALAAGEFRASFGDYAAHSAALDARSARGEKIDLTVSASYAERDGYINNTQLGTRVDDQRTSSVAARLRVRPTAVSEFTLQLLGNRHRDGAQPLAPLSGASLFSVARSREGSTASDFGGGALKGAFDTAAGRLTATTSYTDWSLNPYDNRLVLPPTLDSKIIQTQRAWNEELRLASDPRAALAWHAGAWFSDGTTRGDVNRAIPGLFPVEVSTYEIQARSYALFGEAVFAPADGWRVTAGLRAEQVEKNFTRRQRVPAPGAFVDAENFRALLPKLAVTRALSADTNFSASLAVGTKPGGWSAYTAKSALAGYQAETATAFETGLDTKLADKTVTLAARVFATAIRHYQIERSFNASDYLVASAPRARATGGELEAAWRPVPEWTLAATLGVTEVTLREFTDPFTLKSYAGRRAPYAPAYDAHLSAQWRAAPHGWFAAAEAAFTGKTFYDESENPLFASAAHTVLSARLGYDAPRWRVTAFTENLADEKYRALVIPGVRHAVPGAPRTWGLEAALKW